ncbi:MAG: Cof-type HAD-IIB family hydrolase [Clostridiales bacterium]|nr:Cof-type HAD-IIB family hydrolase [Clostridiales bacterium]
MIKLIATDLDHTLLDLQGLVPEETKEYIRRAVDDGIFFAISTGRSIKSARGVAESIGAAYMAICYNGALVIDPVNGVTIYENYLEEDIVRQIVDYAHEHDLYIQMYDEGTIVVEKLRLERHPDPDLRYADYREVGDFSTYPFFHTPKVLLACEPERVPVEQAALQEILGDRVYMAQSDAHLIEVVSGGVDKGIALENLAGYLGCTKDEIIAFGDNTNDLPLLKAAGTSVAVANAVPSVKEWASFIATKERSEGFNEGLLHYIPSLER